MVYHNQLKVGNVKVLHKNKNISTILNSLEFDKFLEQMDNFDFDIGNIPPGFEHRADLISNLFYDTPTLDWLISWFNNVSDPFQQLNIRYQIKIPKINV
jgi:hypothetical protein